MSKDIFFLWTFCFYSARPRRFGEKKVTRNIEKKHIAKDAAFIHDLTVLGVVSTTSKVAICSC